jgi:hypothetical protein
MKNPQTTIALTFLTHIISGIDGVYSVVSFVGVCHNLHVIVKNADAGQINKPSSDSKCLLKCWQLPPVEQFCMSPAALLRIFRPNMHSLLQAI